MYDYYEAVKNDVMEYIHNEIDLDEFRGNRDGLEEQLNDDLWIEDSVTGNASGSYTFNRNKAREYVMGNTDLLAECMQEFCTPAEEVGKRFLDEDFEYFDVSIRCYLLAGAISDALDEIEEAGSLDEIADPYDGITEALTMTAQKAARA